MFQQKLLRLDDLPLNTNEKCTYINFEPNL